MLEFPFIGIIFAFELKNLFMRWYLEYDNGVKIYFDDCARPPEAKTDVIVFVGSKQLEGDKEKIGTKCKI